MKIAVTIDPKAALLAGKNEHGLKVIDIDPAQLTAAQKQAMIDLGDMYPSGRLPDDAVWSYKTYGIAEATPETFLAWLDRKIEDDTRAKAEHLAKRLRDARSWIATGTRPYIYGDNLKTFVEGFDDDTKARVLELEASMKSAKREAAEREKAEKEAAERAEVAKRKAGELALREWGEKNGSELLRERIAGGFSWKELCREEFFAAARPEGFAFPDTHPSESDPVFYAIHDRTVPDLDEIQALKEARSEYSNVSLRYVTLEHLCKYGCEDEECELNGRTLERRVSLMLRLTAPDGETRDVEKIIKQLPL